MTYSVVPLAGYNTGGTLAGAPMAMVEWEVNPEVDDTDATNTEAGGFHIPFPGPVKAEINVTMLYDGSESPYEDGSPSLQAGQFVPLVIYINDNAAVGATPSWDFPQAMVKSAKNMGKVKDKVMIQAVFIGSGEFSYPQGAVI